MASNYKFINSDRIVVFPSGHRDPSADATSRLTTEYNLVNLVNRLVNTSNDGFVITDTVDSNNRLLQFSIGGYYFRVDDYTDITSLTGLSSATSIYAAINVNNPNNLYQFQELAPVDATVNDNYVLDSGTDFIGLGFLDSQPTGTITHSLLILQKVGGTWVIPESSKIKFRVKSPLGHTVTLSIDDGDLTDGYTTQSGDRL